MKKYFSQNYKELIPATIKEVREVMGKSLMDSGVLHRRGDNLVTKKIYADINKLMWRECKLGRSF